LFANWDVGLYYTDVLGELVTYEDMPINTDWQQGWDIKKGLINHSCHECYEDVKFVNFIVPKLLWWTRLLMPMLLNFDGHFQ
jgi:hypothetical protein